MASLNEIRTHFWELAARLYGGVAAPVK